MYVHVPGRIDRRCISQLTPRSRDHHLFLHAAGSLCKVCVGAWLNRGADTSRGSPCEPLKSAFRLAEEAHANDEFVSMLRAPAGAQSRSRPAECERATTGAARCGRPLSQDGRRGLPKGGLLLLQFRRYWRFSAGMRAPRLEAMNAYPFLTSGLLGQTIKVAVLRWLQRPWAATWRG